MPLTITMPELDVKGTVYWMTHGDRVSNLDTPNPGLVSSGRGQARRLGKAIKKEFVGKPFVVVGTSVRLNEVALESGFTADLYSPVVGIPDCGVKHYVPLVLLADGRHVLETAYNEAALAAGAVCLLNALPTISVVIGSRLPDIGINRSAAVYRISGSSVELLYAE